jgi:uncharacterized damage-inducible protein DinB
MTADQARAVAEVMTGVIEQEAAATRKIVRAITDRAYRPDAKARTAWELAAHLTLSDIWFADSILSGAFVWAGEPPMPSGVASAEDLAQWHERTLADRLARLRGMSSEHMLRPLSFFGRSAPAVTWLTLMNNHAVHHRGQLATYLRPMGSKVPAIYGMSADEPVPAA